MTAALRGSSAAFLKTTATKKSPPQSAAMRTLRLTLFAVRAVTTDPDHARRVLRKLAICSRCARIWCAGAFSSACRKKNCTSTGWLQSCCRRGPAFCGTFSDEAAPPGGQGVQHLNSEAHLLKGFVFFRAGRRLGGEIAPKNRVLPLLRSHFCARYLNESFFLYDRTPQGRRCSTPAAGR